MTQLPTISDVIAWLNDRDQQAMAVVVQRLDDECQRAKETSAYNYAAFRELQARHEPPVLRYVDYTPPPEASG